MPVLPHYKPLGTFGCNSNHSLEPICTKTLSLPFPPPQRCFIWILKTDWPSSLWDIPLKVKDNYREDRQQSLRWAKNSQTLENCKAAAQQSVYPIRTWKCTVTKDPIFINTLELSHSKTNSHLTLFIKFFETNYSDKRFTLLITGDFYNSFEPSYYNYFYDSIHCPISEVMLYPSNGASGAFTDNGMLEESLNSFFTWYGWNILTANSTSVKIYL